MKITTVDQSSFFRNQYETTITDTVNGVDITVTATKGSQEESVRQAFQTFASASGTAKVWGF